VKVGPTSREGRRVPGVWVAPACLVGVAAGVLALPALWGGPAPHGGEPSAEGARRGAGDSAIGGGPGIEQGGPAPYRAGGVHPVVGDGGWVCDGGWGCHPVERLLPIAAPSIAELDVERRTRDGCGDLRRAEPSRAREKNGDERASRVELGADRAKFCARKLKLDFFNFPKRGSVLRRQVDSMGVRTETSLA
jgi:hypothetical protein